jgi:hypothetical protein
LNKPSGSPVFSGWDRFAPVQLHGRSNSQTGAHWKESNLRPRGGAHFQVSSQYHLTNPSRFRIVNS